MRARGTFCRNSFAREFDHLLPPTCRRISTYKQSFSPPFLSYLSSLISHKFFLLPPRPQISTMFGAKLTFVFLLSLVAASLAAPLSPAVDVGLTRRTGGSDIRRAGGGQIGSDSRRAGGGQIGTDNRRAEGAPDIRRAGGGPVYRRED